ncbi:hypothetical protein NL676_029026 [Syzygium grande]|nr:hypothetical protein NL676_029026 [Syzygium grande]
MDYMYKVDKLWPEEEARAEVSACWAPRRRSGHRGRDGGGFRVQDGQAVAEAGQGEGGDPEGWGMQVSEAMASMSADGALTIVIPKRHQPRER